MSRKDAERNRDRVLRTASEMFRQGGYDGVGIASLMKAAGLTNGAFYKQFDSKEALIAEATAYGLDANEEIWKEVLENTDGDPDRAIADFYLSDPHLMRRDKGCTYAALAAEAPRHQNEVRKVFEQGLRRTLTLLSAKSETEPGEETKAIRNLSRLVGALILARAVDDPALSKEILRANHTPEG